MSEQYDDSEQEPDYDCLNNFWIWATESAIEEAENEDRYEALVYGSSDRTAGEQIPFHPLFPAVFLRRVGGEPSDSYTVPSMALEDWLQTNFYSRCKERPAFDYLIGLLEDEFPHPAPRIQKAIAWLQKMRAACPPWPARWAIESGFVVPRVMNEPEQPEAASTSSSAAAESTAIELHSYVPAGAPTVAELCRAPFATSDLTRLLQHLGAVGPDEKDKTERRKGKAQGAKSAYAAAYQYLLLNGNMNGTPGSEWADALEAEYGTSLGKTIRGYALEGGRGAGSHSFNDYVEKVKAWVKNHLPLNTD